MILILPDHICRAAVRFFFFFFENVINRYTNASDWWKFIIFVLTCTRDHPSLSVCTMELVFGK